MVPFSFAYRKTLIRGKIVPVTISCIPTGRFSNSFTLFVHSVLFKAQIASNL